MVFIIATGRSGSTSLLTLLRELPGSDVLGENGGGINSLWRLDKQLKAAADLRHRDGAIEKRVAWLHRPSDKLQMRSELVASYRKILEATVNWRIVPGETVLLGFKEVRWAFQDQLADAELLLELYPCAKLILSYREDMETQAASGFHSVSEDRRRTVKSLRLMNEALAAFAERHPQATLMMEAGSVSDKAALNHLLSWLGFPYCSVKDVPRVNLGGRMSTADELCGGEACVEGQRRFLDCSSMG